MITLSEALLKKCIYFAVKKKCLLHNNNVYDCETENANRAVVVGLIHDAEDWRHKNDSFFLFYDV